MYSELILRWVKTYAPSTLSRRTLKTEVSLWKHIKCFPSTLRRGNLKTQESPVILDFFEEYSVKEITWLSSRYRFRQAPFSKYIPSTRKREAGGFRILRYEERFRKAPFWWWISVKAAFSNSSGVLWSDPWECTPFVRKLLGNSILLQHSSVYFSEYLLLLAFLILTDLLQSTAGFTDCPEF